MFYLGKKSCRSSWQWSEVMGTKRNWSCSCWRQPFPNEVFLHHLNTLTHLIYFSDVFCVHFVFVSKVKFCFVYCSLSWLHFGIVLKLSCLSNVNMFCLFFSYFFDSDVVVVLCFHQHLEVLLSNCPKKS